MQRALPVIIFALAGTVHLPHIVLWALHALFSHCLRSIIPITFTGSCIFTRLSTVLLISSLHLFMAS